MPRGYETGPTGQGPGTGRGMGRGGAGQGRMGGNRPGAGLKGVCTCPQCGATLDHKPGIPCYQIVCPLCGTVMIRG
jgi:hypothetical protein